MSRATGEGAKGDLSEREREVVRYLPTPLSSAEIAVQLYISLNTLKTHLRAIYRKLGVDGRQKAVRRGVELGIPRLTARPERSLFRIGQTLDGRQLDAQVTELGQQALEGWLVRKPSAEMGRIPPGRPHLEVVEPPDEGAPQAPADDDLIPCRSHVAASSPVNHPASMQVPGHGVVTLSA